MARNVEIKATIPQWHSMQAAVAAIADAPPTEFAQEDVFSHVPNGRLKMRTQNGAAELIYYIRSDDCGPRQSSYLRLPVGDPSFTRNMLAAIHGERGVIRKVRRLYLVGQTRIHLDRVDGLGDFLELEVVLRAHQSSEAGVAIARDLMKRLAISDNQLVDRAYVDCLNRK